eukprot:CAMPEP_0180133068 /NCGR_PEP_ID=MMETSP0986-20121125/9334_1 /TAXON_ID=697907 /ORGANISM="non described non described, Strain CCMP2293" /LENGTH=158 /DNA_ID=CAMNT_0022073143 /DNA_START=1398 /DNA_END=1871 /DNA_ORIENTATION=-
MFPYWNTPPANAADSWPSTTTRRGSNAGPSPPHGGVTHASAASSVHSVAWHRVAPTYATGCESVSPKLRPCTSTRSPPSTAPCVGATLRTCGALYEKRESPEEDAVYCPSIRTVTLPPPPAPGGVVHVTRASESQVESMHSIPPTSTCKCPAPVPRSF